VHTPDERNFPRTGDGMERARGHVRPR
jgi:hypothetical protein